VGTFKLGLVVTCQVNGSSPFNVPDIFPPVSRGPRPQCQANGLTRLAGLQTYHFEPNLSLFSLWRATYWTLLAFHAFPPYFSASFKT